MKTIQLALNDLWDAWVEARAEQAKYYNMHTHIE
jgi:hypothetical protein